MKDIKYDRFYSVTNHERSFVIRNTIETKYDTRQTKSV